MRRPPTCPASRRPSDRALRQPFAPAGQRPSAPVDHRLSDRAGHQPAWRLWRSQPFPFFFGHAGAGEANDNSRCSDKRGSEANDGGVHGEVTLSTDAAFARSNGTLHVRANSYGSAALATEFSEQTAARKSRDWEPGSSVKGSHAVSRKINGPFAPLRTDPIMVRPLVGETPPVRRH